MTIQQAIDSFINGNYCEVADELSISHPAKAARIVLMLSETGYDQEANTLTRMLETRYADAQELGKAAKDIALDRWGR